MQDFEYSKSNFIVGYLEFNFVMKFNDGVLLLFQSKNMSTTNQQ